MDNTDLNLYKNLIEEHILDFLPEVDHKSFTVYESMRYSLAAGGKRIRPILLLAAWDFAGGDVKNALPYACAVEYIHTYSLIHDDLPAMDDDDLRRGRPTVHKAFDEATAILAGDALQCLAFELLSRPGPGVPNEHQRLQQIRTLSRACGSLGMAGGQALDLSASAGTIDESRLETIHTLKTGALMAAAVCLAADLVLADTDADYQRLARFAKTLGLAFQVRDDILDITTDTAVLGKRQGADLAHDKATYPALLGLPGAQQKALDLHRQALDELAALGTAAEPLRRLANELLTRPC